MTTRPASGRRAGVDPAPACPARPSTLARRAAPGAGLVAMLLVGGCTTVDGNVQSGQVSISRFWSDVGINGTRDCSPLAHVPPELMTKLGFQQLLLLCSGQFAYSSQAGDPNMAAAIGQLGSLALKGAAGAP